MCLSYQKHGRHWSTSVSRCYLHADFFFLKKIVHLSGIYSISQMSSLPLPLAVPEIQVGYVQPREPFSLVSNKLGLFALDMKWKGVKIYSQYLQVDNCKDCTGLTTMMVGCKKRFTFICYRNSLLTESRSTFAGCESPNNSGLKRIYHNKVFNILYISCPNYSSEKNCSPVLLVCSRVNLFSKYAVFFTVNQFPWAWSWKNHMESVKFGIPG